MEMEEEEEEEDEVEEDEVEEDEVEEDEVEEDEVEEEEKEEKEKEEKEHHISSSTGNLPVLKIQDNTGTFGLYDASPETVLAGESIAVLGLRYTQRAQLRDGTPVEADTVICNAMQGTVSLSVFSVNKNLASDNTNGTDVDHDAVFLHSDFTTSRAWLPNPRHKRRGSPEEKASELRKVIMGRGTTIVVMQYYRLEKETFKQTRGYGGGVQGTAWITTILPIAFSKGLKVAILPNDRWGELVQMIEREEDDYNQTNNRVQQSNRPARPKMAWQYLDEEEALRFHPLFRATEAAVKQPLAWKNSVVKHSWEMNNNSIVTQYLNLDHPFIVYYNTTTFNSWEDAKRYLLSVQRDH
jgi:hypothetical protein